MSFRPNEDELRAKEESIKDLEITIESKEESVDSNEIAPAPQIKLGPNGEIVLDETSLVSSYFNLNLESY